MFFGLVSPQPAARQPAAVQAAARDHGCNFLICKKKSQFLCEGGIFSRNGAQTAFGSLQRVELQKIHEIHRLYVQNGPASAKLWPVEVYTRKTQGFYSTLCKGTYPPPRKTRRYVHSNMLSHTRKENLFTIIHVMDI